MHFQVQNLVNLIKMYQNKNKLSKVLMATSFKRRQEDLEVAIDRALQNLQVGPLPVVLATLSSLDSVLAEIFHTKDALGKVYPRRSHAEHSKMMVATLYAEFGQTASCRHVDETRVVRPSSCDQHHLWGTVDRKL